MRQLPTHFCVLVTVLGLAGTTFAQGLVFSGAGAISRSMGGASTAVGLDPVGAGYWNPAAIRAVETNQVSFNAELLYGDTSLSSSVGAQHGSNFSNSGLPAIPTIGMVYHSEQIPATFGLGVYALMGGGINVPQSADNPITNATGPIYASASALAIQPSVALQLTDRLTVGFGPTISTISMGMNPAFFAPNGPGDYPIATPGRPSWGGGFQVGVLYDYNDCWDFGFGYKSPIWYGKLHYNGQDGAGQPREFELSQSLPQIISVGLGYHGIEGLTIAADLRYLDYANTTLWGDSIPTPGLAWSSVFAVALGAEYQLSDRMAVRAGYLANENPIPSVATLFNMQLPTINTNQLALGGSLKLTDAITMDSAIVYGFSNGISGPIPLPGSRTVANIGMRQDFISAVFGMRFEY